jgi:formylmethanofuran dehydrogenase subunit B
MMGSSKAGPRAGDHIRAAETLRDARRVLVTGFRGLTTAAVAAACDLAEALGAAVDAGDPETSRPAAPTIARVGELTADREELRDRADLVVAWFCDPDASCPGFSGDCLARPPTSAGTRRVIAIGPASARVAGIDVVHAPCDRRAAVEAARVLHHMLLHGDAPSHAEPKVATACRTLHAAIEQATCVGFVTDDSSDPVGLEAWSLVHVVRMLAHRKPAFEIPLRPRAAAFDAVCTWRYGAAGAIARADRGGAEFLPGEASAEQLIARCEVDAVVVVGELAPHVEQAIAARGQHLDVIRIAGPDDAILADLRSLLAAIATSHEGEAS